MSVPIPITKTSAVASTTAERSDVLTHPTTEGLLALRLEAMAEGLAEQRGHPDYEGLGFDERLGLLVDRELAERENRRMDRHLKQAKLKAQAVIEDIDFRRPRGLDRAQILGLADAHFVDHHQTVVIVGPPGCGKTHLAVALATTAVEAGYRGYFTTADDMVNTLVKAKREGTIASKLKTLTAPSVLVIDDVGLLPIERGGAGVFFHVVNTRYERGHPTLITTNRGLPEWGEIFGDAVVAAAILDRLMHNAVVFNIKGPSWRMREHHALEQAATDPDNKPERRRR
jgi:DNA replication protein DnaC